MVLNKQSVETPRPSNIVARSLVEPRKRADLKEVSSRSAPKHPEMPDSTFLACTPQGGLQS
jgi:hypothetical protein